MTTQPLCRIAASSCGAVTGSNSSAEWGSAAMLWAEASLLNARDHVTRLAGAGIVTL